MPLEQTSDQPAKKKSGAGWVLGLLIAGMAVVPFWCFMIGPSLRHDRLVEHGMHTQGVLISAEETGNVINDKPELELTVAYRLEDGRFDTSSCDLVPSLRSIHMFQPGAAVSVAYDRDDPKEITVVEIGGPTTLPGVTVIPMETASRADSLQRIVDSLQRAAAGR